MQVYDVAILGATVLSSSVAQKLGKKAIVIEKSESVATDYVSCLNTRLAKIEDVSIPEVKEFRNEFVRRNLISEENTVHVFPLTGICAKYLQKSDVLLSTDIIDIQFIDKLYEITTFNRDGFSKIKAKNILDTTPCGVKLYEKMHFRKYINAVIIGNDPPITDCLYKDRFKDEFVLSLQVHNNCSYSKAVEYMCKTWESMASGEYKDCKLVTIAPQFAYFFDTPVTSEIGEKYIHKPSASYENLGRAFEEGIYAAQLYL